MISNILGREESSKKVLLGGVVVQHASRELLAWINLGRCLVRTVIIARTTTDTMRFALGDTHTALVQQPN